MGALDGGMAGDQLTGAVPVAEAAPPADDVDAPEESWLEMQRIETGATFRTGAPVHKFEDQTTSSRQAGELFDDPLVDRRAAEHRITARGTGRLGPVELAQPQRAHGCHHCGRVPGLGTSVRNRR